MARLLHMFILALALLMQLGPDCAHAEQARITNINGVDYVPVNAAWRKYKLIAVKTPGQDRRYASDTISVTLKPGKQDFYVSKYHYVLSYPIVEQDGELFISVTDVEKLVDPVLDPKYSGRKVTTIVLDPGHGGHDSGAVSPYAREKDCNLSLAILVAQKLRKAGFRVLLTRGNDTFLTLQQRVDIANRTPDCLFVSIHHNSGRSAAHGIETFTLAPHGTTSPFARTRRTEDLAGNNQDSENIALATAVHSRAIKKTEAVDRGIQRARFSVLCTIKRPAILFEAGFVSNPQEGTLITTPAYQEKLADSICEGIQAFCSIICEKNSNIKSTNKLNKGSGSGSIGGSNTKDKKKGGSSKGKKQPSRATMNSRYSEGRTLR